jgi:hypothetical protein
LSKGSLSKVILLRQLVFLSALIVNWHLHYQMHVSLLLAKMPATFAKLYSKWHLVQHGNKVHCHNTQGVKVSTVLTTIGSSFGNPFLNVVRCIIKGMKVMVQFSKEFGSTQDDLYLC